MNSKIGIIVGGVCFALIVIFAITKFRQTNKELVSTKPISPGTYFNKEALNNPVYDENIIESDDDDGYIVSNTYEEPVMNTDSLKQRNLYDLTIDSTYNDIETSDNMYDIASQEPENLYVLGSNNNEFYDNINEEDNEN